VKLSPPLDAEAKAMWIKELDTLRQLEHVHVVKIRGSSSVQTVDELTHKEKWRMVLVMEYLSGGSLSFRGEAVRGGGRVREVLVQVCKALV